MSWKQKLLLGLIALALTFAGGLWVGYHMDRGDVDPQDYIETIFTPYDDGSEAYLAFLDKANESVYMAVYAYTDPRITDKLIELKEKRKVSIHILIDYSQTKTWNGPSIWTQTQRLRKAGIEVVFGTSEKSKDLMHSKFTVIDGLWVEDGSWNYTKAADDQANVQNYIRSPKRAAKFIANWKRMYSFMKAQGLEPTPPDPGNQPAPQKPPTKKRSR